MEPLAINRQVFKWIRVFSIPTDASTIQKSALIVSNLIVLLSAVIASAIFILKFMTNKLEESLFSLHHGSASLNASLALIIAVLFWQKIDHLFENLVTIYDAIENFTINTYFWRWAVNISMNKLNRIIYFRFSSRVLALVIWFRQYFKNQILNPFTREKRHILHMFGWSEQHKQMDVAILLKICDRWLLYFDNNDVCILSFELSEDSRTFWCTARLSSI